MRCSLTSISPSALRPARRRPGLAALAALALLLAPGVERAAFAERCSIELHQDPCAAANPVCPAVAPPVGIAAGSWPVFQGNVQHTGVSPFNGPTCSNQVWSRTLLGDLLAASALAPGRPGEPETLFVPVGKSPLCALNPADGSVYWCHTDFLGKLADRSSPLIGNGDLAYIGTRDNDLWAINVPPVGDSDATVAWQQFVCTDGDITAPPIMASDGLTFMASDSIGAGTLMAMCPGPTRQVKWCKNPLGGGIRNASPALSPSGDELYVMFGGGTVLALDPETGDEHWRVQLEPAISIGRTPNHAPVVNPVTGRIYVGLMGGLYAVDRPAVPGGTPTSALLFDTSSIGRVDAPPALDLAHGSIVVGVSNGPSSALFALDLTGHVKWQRNDLGVGRFRANNPPVVDASGRIYLTLGKSLIALQSTGANEWRKDFKKKFESSPILANGRVYVGTADGTMYAIGDCPA
jgi:outer membrane protein assembly factor BamB